MGLEQSPAAVAARRGSSRGWMLCTHRLRALGFKQLLHVSPTDLYSQEFELNFAFALLGAQRAAAHILSLLYTPNGFDSSWHYLLTSKGLFFLRLYTICAEMCFL